MLTGSMVSASAMIKSLVYSMLVLVCLTLLTPQSARAELSKLNEYEVKAAYLYNFTKFVEWPAAASTRDNSPLVICIVGKSPLNEVIESLAGKTIKNRRLVIRQFSRIEDLSECNILFINAAVKTSIGQILSSVTSRPILTVSDSKGFAAAGGNIEFINVEDKIRFKINNRAAQQVNIKISSHLLRLATTVIE
jgi:hypothetical protein